MAGLLEDARFALRSLVKYRGFTLVAVLSLALGIGANSTVFTLINGILLHPLLVEDPSRLAAVFSTDSRNPGLRPCSYPNFKDLRDRNQVFSSLLLYGRIGVNLTGHGDPKLVMGQLVSGNYFSTLGVKPAIGRGFLPEEDAVESARAVVVISHRFWQQEFAADPRVTGRTIELNGRAYQIVGVAPAGFAGIDTLAAADIWTPMMMYPEVFPTLAWVNQRRALLFGVVGRLKPGLSVGEAEAGLQVLMKDLQREYPRDNAARGIKLTSLSDAAIRPQDRAPIANASTVLLIISSIVLLIGCGNVASLLLVRAAGRRKEISLRLAMGASRRRLVRQLLTESIALALAGGAAGLLFARWARDILWNLRPPILSFASIQLDLDGRVLGYTLAVSVFTGILFGLFPAWRATQPDLAVDLKERAGDPASARGKWSFRSVLVMLQVAFSLVALVGAGLFVRSLMDAGRINPGFDADHLGAVAFDVSNVRYNEGRGREFQRRALEVASATPGVSAATLAKDWPFNVSLRRTVLLDGQTASSEGRMTLVEMVAPGYLSALRIPLLRGRDFSTADAPASPRVAIVNETAAETFWPGGDPVGKVVRFYGDNRAVEIIGVARKANYFSIGEAPQPLIYLSMDQYYFPDASLYIRTAGDPGPVLAAVRRQVQGLDHNLVLNTQTTRDIVWESLWPQRLSANLLAVFGSLALLLAAIGIYGVISYSVGQRAREIGVRMALGATPGEVHMMLLRQGIRMVAIGVVVGLAISTAASRMVRSMLFVIGPHDAVTFVMVPSILVLVGMFACWLPARRATRIDPAIALRDE